MKKTKDLYQKKFLTKKDKNFSKWYTEVILQAELADYAPVKGCMVIRPYGYSIWENIQQAFDRMIKRYGVKNAYFPLFIPESLLKREKEHVEGFSPELAVVTIGGGKKLKEKLVVRPTSETIMYAMYAKWLQSWRDLPILINQWNNVVRWEKRTHLFLRTTEFLWQEGHTVHETHQQALKQVHKALNWYINLYRDFLAIEGVAGTKSQAEKFAGARETFAFEMLMPDGKALQGATSHDLGQNFSKVFEMKFQDRSGKQAYPWQTSWGLTTRSIGALIMAHGDDNGLVLPPKLAPVQVVIIPIFKTGSFDPQLQDYLRQIKSKLRNLRVHVDNREEVSVGWKFNEWELKGVPLRIEVGDREVKAETIKLARRDTGTKHEIPLLESSKIIRGLLDKIQKDMLKKSSDFLKSNTSKVDDYPTFKSTMATKRGFLLAFWCGNPSCEQQIKKETKATTRCLPLNAPKESGKCILCGKRSEYRWIFAQAY